MTPKVCCIKVGSKYGPEYVNRLYRMVEENTTHPHEFVCLTDDPRGVECQTVPVGTELSGWWSKLVLFKPHPALKGHRVIFLDLDTIILGNIDFLFDYKGDFAILRDFYHPKGYGSAIMSIEPGFGSQLWTSKHILGYHGDQDWIRANVKDADLWQDLYPGKIVSFKVHCQDVVPTQASIVCFHGYPKNSDLHPDRPLRRTWEQSPVAAQPR